MLSLEELVYIRKNQRRSRITRTRVRRVQNLPVRSRLATQFPRNEKQAGLVSSMERKDTFSATVLR